jgi:hypothetical protein
MTKLSSSFGLTNLGLRNVFLCTLKALDQVLENEVKWPDNSDFESIVSTLHAEVRENFPNLGTIVDGTEIRVPRPSDNELQKTVYSKKKHQHSVTVLLICTPHGHLIFASDPQTGASDQRHWNTLNLREYFEDKPYGVKKTTIMKFKNFP